MIRSFHSLLAALLLLTVNCSLLTDLHAQTPKSYNSSEILLGLKKLNVLGSVMYLAAHPDDENTRLIAYMANERLLETSYLSCTRGDGGQNLIGPELREQLGVIRTQELLAARRLDGGRQFFTRANDFGYSKTPEETFRIWDKEQVLADMVWVIRQRRPDVLLTRFPPDARAGHGHHQASALLAAEAFDAAGDPQRFPEQLPYVQAWQPKRLLWNTGSFFVKPGDDLSGYLKLDAGGYNPLLGQSYGEIAARSRSNHRSQGFGSAAQRGEALEYFQPVKGDKATKDLFEGVDQTWNRVPGGAAVGQLIEKVIRTYDLSNPSASVAGLLKVREQLLKLQQVARANSVDGSDNSDGWEGSFHEVNAGPFWVVEKTAEVERLAQACLGLTVEALAPAAVMGVNQTMRPRIEVLNRSAIPVTVKEVSLDGTTPGLSHDTTWTPLLVPGRTLVLTPRYKVRDCGPYFQPYWLRETSPQTGMYRLPNRMSLNRWVNPSEELDAPQTLIDANELERMGTRTNKRGVAQTRQLVGRPENPAIAAVSILLQVGTGQPWLLTVPIQFKHTDPVLGELYQSFVSVSPVLVNLPANRAYIFANQEAKTVPVTVRAGWGSLEGSVHLQAPEGWVVEPESAPFKIKNKDGEQTVNFLIHPTSAVPAGKTELKVFATISGGFDCVPGPEEARKYSHGIKTITYPHIPTQFLFPDAVAPLVKLDLKRRGQHVAYLMGAGDEVPDALRQIGYTVTLLKPEELSAARLQAFDALVVGIRAYNTVDALKTKQAEILKYIEGGGNVVVQYVVSRATVLPEIGPYPLTLSNDRVTVEDAPVTLSKHPLLQAPNKITEQDFQGWVQEQGLYYPSKWDPHYQTVISSHDPGEAPKESAILVADYGKGHYIYTGLSLFRELPAGVPGAYRLITNMISYGH